jgi:hypothetical protein
MLAHREDGMGGACSANIVNETFVNVTELKYFGTILTDLSFVYEEVNENILY